LLAYLRGRADFEVDPRRCALMLIDLQEEFVTPELTPFWVPDATQALPRVRRLRDGCREIGVPVLYTAFGGAHGGLDRPRSGAGMPNRFPQVRPM
jgi:isochorismate hydrolase